MIRTMETGDRFYVRVKDGEHDIQMTDPNFVESLKVGYQHHDIRQCSCGVFGAHKHVLAEKVANGKGFALMWHVTSLCECKEAT